jgi:hypothetical protein
MGMTVATFVAAIASLLSLPAPQAAGQADASATNAFEAASIKPSAEARVVRAARDT